MLRIALLSLVAASALVGAVALASRPAPVLGFIESEGPAERIGTTGGGPSSHRALGTHARTLSERPGGPGTMASNETTPPERRLLSTNILLAFAGVLGVCLAALVVQRRRVLAHAEATAAGRLRRLPTTLELGGAYLLAGPDTSRAYAVLLSYVDAGANGVVLSRRYPDDLRSRFSVGSSAVLWLSRGFSRAAVNPANLVRMVNTIERHIAGREASIVLIDNLEYLVVLNGAPAVARFLELLAEAIATHSSRLLVSLDPDGITSADLTLLSRDLRPL